jgi:hypothetical protein
MFARLISLLFLAVPAQAAPVQPLHVVELFQSQGCSSCPPANANVGKLAGRRDLIVLSWAITYWDRLGWPDRFAQPAFTVRQWDFANFNGRSQVWTPQIWINGRRDTTGVRPGQLTDALAATPPLAAGPALSVAGDALSIAAGPAPATPADVWLVHYDPAERRVAVGRGENAGRTLAHRNIVTGLKRLGRWDGAAAQWPLPPTPAGQAAVVLVQAGRGGPILNAARLP